MFGVSESVSSRTCSGREGVCRLYNWKTTPFLLLSPLSLGARLQLALPSINLRRVLLSLLRFTSVSLRMLQSAACSERSLTHLTPPSPQATPVLHPLLDFSSQRRFLSETHSRVFDTSSLSTFCCFPLLHLILPPRLDPRRRTPVFGGRPAPSRWTSARLPLLV